MNYIIDGHNLIAKMKVLDLSMPDDEQRLIELLGRFGLARKHRLEAYFDGAPAGLAGVRQFGKVRAHFVSQRQTADEAIRNRLRELGRSARSWVVVSSDRAVQAAAHEAQARVLSSEEFSGKLVSALSASQGDAERAPDQTLSEAEVNEWLAIFMRRGKTDGGKDVG